MRIKTNSLLTSSCLIELVNGPSQCVNNERGREKNR